MTIHDYSTGEMPKEGAARWDTKEMQEVFQVHSFAAPFVMVTRKSDGAKGTLQFNHNPRVYFDFLPE